MTNRPPRPRPATTKASRPGEAASRHVAGRTAQDAPGQGSDTAASSSWLAEREGAHGAAPPGVPLDLAHPPSKKVLESRRSKHKSG
jgi:hypothetical protein